MLSEPVAVCRFAAGQLVKAPSSVSVYFAIEKSRKRLQSSRCTQFRLISISFVSAKKMRVYVRYPTTDDLINAADRLFKVPVKLHDANSTKSCTNSTLKTMGNLSSVLRDRTRAGKPKYTMDMINIRTRPLNFWAISNRCVVVYGYGWLDVYFDLPCTSKRKKLFITWISSSRFVSPYSASIHRIVNHSAAVTTAVAAFKVRYTINQPFYN